MTSSAIFFFSMVTALVLSAQEQSVKPGINDPFEDPNVPQFIERFEKEGREVYDQRAEIIAALGIGPGTAVADIGCGTGLFTRMLGKEVGKTGTVYAVDIARKFVDYTLLTCSTRGLMNVQGVVCPPDDSGLAPESIDLAFVCATYHHFEYPFKSMSSLRKALRPGGAVVIVDFERIPGISSDWILNHVRAGREEVIEEIRNSGFELVEERDDLFSENYFLRFEPLK
ncbi:MAG: methyltransferase domain-containing protein [Verrucomicrobiota bacterium]